MKSMIERLVGGLVGGVVGGAAVGIAESAVIAMTSSATEYWVFVFGAVSYGLFGMAMGAGWAVTASFLPFDRSQPRVVGTSAGIALGGLGFVVSRFRIARDLFSESLPVVSGTGFLVHCGLVIAAVVVFVLARRVIERAVRRHGVGGVAFRWGGGLVAGGLLAAAVLTVVLGGETAPPGRVDAPVATKGPNVVLIIADTLRADHVGAYGVRQVRTPSLDALAADSVLFENTFADSSWTRPSIATILTSLYASSHQVMHKTDLLPEAVQTLAETMGGSGYETTGFVTNINVAPSFHFEQGFDRYDYLAPDFFFGATDSGSKLSLYSGMRLIRERFLSSRKFVNHYYQDADTVNATSLPWLNREGARPFFVLIHYMDAHDPYFEIPYNGRAVARVETPNPAPERAEEIRRLYEANVEYMDRFLGALFDTMKRAGLYENSIIVFTADHGEEFQEHGGWWHGTTLYDEVLHVPLIVKLPGERHAGTRRVEIARLVDVMPTILTAAGVRVPVSCQGRDLFGTDAPPSAVYAEEDHEGNVLEAVRTKRWKLILANEGNPRGLPTRALYDLQSDPAEQRNLASTQPERVAALEADLRMLEQAAGSRAVAGVRGEIDEASKERLRALGYIQ